MLTVATCFVALAFAADEHARATTFCVPTFSAACPNNGSNVAEPILEKAMGLNGTDGVPDQILVAAGTVVEDGGFEPASGFKDPASFEPVGSDPLTIVGAGTGATVLTTSGSGNVYMLNLSNNGNSRAIAIRDLTLQVPASFPDGLGSTILLFNGDVLEGVDIVSLNKESDGVSSVGVGNLAKRVALSGGGAEGLIGDGFSAGSSGAALTVEDSEVDGASWALVTSGTGSHLVARRVVETGTRTYGAIGSEGTLSVENSIFELDDAIGLFGSAAAQDGTVEADHVTVVNSGGSGPALEGKKFSSTAGDVSIDVANSIFRGFGSGYRTETPFGPGIGIVSISARYSNLPSNGSSMGGTVDFGTGNIDVDPQLTADFSLPVGSPSIDAGDPAAGLVDDFAGAPRPADGNGDGVAIRDQGAFERQPPMPPVCCDPPPPCCDQGEGGQGGNSQQSGGSSVDLTGPRTKVLAGPGSKLAAGKARFRFSSSEAGSSFQCKLGKGKPKPCISPKRYTGLAPGRYVFKVWATDAAGNKSTKPAKKRFRVPAA